MTKRRMAWWSSAVLSLALLAVATNGKATSLKDASAVGSMSPGQNAADLCLTDVWAPEYYSFELEATDKIPEFRDAMGEVLVSYPSSPFGLPVTRNGTAIHQLSIKIDAPEAPDGQVLVAWASDPTLTQIQRLGIVSPDRPGEGRSRLNKYMVFVTVESTADSEADRWRGPVVLVGRARSARIQSMASHGTFEAEPC